MHNELTSDHDRVDAMARRCMRIAFRVVGVLNIAIGLLLFWDYVLASGRNVEPAAVASMTFIGSALILVCAERIRT